MFLKQEIKILCIILAEAQTQEKESLQNLQHLIHMTCESLGLWKVICDHQFHVVASALTKVRMIKFCTVVFEHHYRPQMKGVIQGGWADPPPPEGILWDTVKKQAVRILLESILVF